MKFEIPLNGLQIETLQRTRGFEEPSPVSLEEGDIIRIGGSLSEVRKQKGIFDDSRIVKTPHNTSIELVFLTAQLEDEYLYPVNEILRKYTSAQSEEARRSRSPLNISATDLAEIQMLEREHQREYDKKIVPVFRGNERRAGIVIRSLLGILGLVGGIRYDDHTFEPIGYDQRYLILDENRDAVLEAVKTGKFVKEITADDVLTLRQVREMQKQRKEFRLHKTESALELRASLGRLGGVLCHEYGNDEETNYEQWFIPESRIGLARELVK